MKRFLLPAALLMLLAPMTWAQGNLDWAEPSSSSYGSETSESGPMIDDQAGVPGLPDAPDAVPIDGGLTLLGAAGAAYAVNRLRSRRKDQQT